MDTHHVHDEELGFHTGTDEAKEWLGKGLSREGLQKYLREAQEKGSLNFKDHAGNRFKLVHNKEDGSFSVQTRH